MRRAPADPEAEGRRALSEFWRTISYGALPGMTDLDRLGVSEKWWPWLSGRITEVHHELKSGDHAEARRLAEVHAASMHAELTRTKWQLPEAPAPDFEGWTPQQLAALVPRV